MLRRIALLLVWLQALPASALVVEGANSGRAEAPPRDGSAWAHVGRLGSNTAIYLGEGWILSASHSGVTDVTFEGVSYPPVPGSKIRLDAPDGSKRKSDLALFRVEPAPELPRLPLRRRPVAPGTLVTLVGFGAGPGEPVVWRGEHGFRGAAGRRKRWGTNLVLRNPADVRGPGAETITRCFQTRFDEAATPHEAQASKGDSGGAVFVRGPRGWRLAGVMVSVFGHAEQPPELVLYGNLTNAADIPSYLPQILRALEDAAEPAAPLGDDGAPVDDPAHPLP